jgi:hypothetical protein
MFGCLQGDERVHEVARWLSPRRERLSSSSVLFACGKDVRPQVRQFLSDLGIEATFGCGSSRFLAEMAAPLDRTVEDARFLAPLSVTHLPVERETMRRLQLLGLREMGQLLRFTQEELYSQFGDEGFLVWELVRGIDHRLLVLEQEEELLEEEATFEEGLTPALRRLFGRLAERNLLCMRLVLQVAEHLVEIGFSRGISDLATAEKHILMRLPRLAQPEPIRIVVAESCEQELKQLTLFDRPKQRWHLRKPTALMRVVWDDRRSRLPERRAHLESRLRSGVTRPLYTPKSFSVDQFRGRRAKLLDRWDIDEEWWGDNPISRTYLQLHLDNGARLRLFRDRREDRWFRQ